MHATGHPQFQTRVGGIGLKIEGGLDIVVNPDIETAEHDDQHPDRGQHEAQAEQVVLDLFPYQNPNIGLSPHVVAGGTPCTPQEEHHVERQQQADVRQGGLQAVGERQSSGRKRGINRRSLG